jgi:hypothetical protein
MVNKIDTIPNEKIDEGRENIAADFLGNGPFGFLLVFEPGQHTQIGFPCTHSGSEYN